MARAAAAAAAALLLLAGCGGEEPRAPELTAERIERLASPAEESGVDRGVQLRPLDAAGLDGAACRLLRDGATLLLARAGGAVARVEDRVVRLEASGPVGGTGGYFEADGLSISIGRIEAADAAGPNALVQVNDRATGAMREFDADWRCA